MRTILAIIIIISLSGCYHPNQNLKQITADVSNNIVKPKHYIVHKTPTPINIDGIANEKSWNLANFTDQFIDIEGIAVPKYSTKVKMLWDESNLYVYAELEEPHIWADISKRDNIIYLNNDFEVFIDASGTGTNYGEIEINALGTIFDLSLNKAYRVGGKANIHWNLNELKSAVNIKGSINNPKDIDTSWSVEMAIPLNAFVEFKNKPQTYPNDGEQWRINFSRVEWDFDTLNNNYERKKVDGKFLAEHNWVWSPQMVINMHEPEKWGILQFSDKYDREEVKFTENENQIYEQIAFTLFRETLTGNLKYLQNAEQYSKLTINVKYTDTDSLEVNFHKTLQGFEIDFKSPSNNKTYCINHEGDLKIIE